MISQELLLDYAAGSLPEPVSLAVATHLSLKPEARQAYTRLNDIGGAMLANVEGRPLPESALEETLKRLDGAGPPGYKGPPIGEQTSALIPPPLRRYLKADLQDLDWSRVKSGVEEHRLTTAHNAYRTSLFRIRPGEAMPRHTHRGLEYTVVLAGSYDDGAVHLERGDFCEAEPTDTHQPVADPERGCLCLIVLDSPLKLTGLVGRMINPFLKH